MPNGDVWATDAMKGQLVHFPKGDSAKGELLCQNPGGNPLNNPCKLLAPFALAIDQKDNIWIRNIIGEHVTRFPASDPGKVETFKTGFSGSELAVDSQGNVWITNKLGSSGRGRLKLLEMVAAAKINFSTMMKLTRFCGDPNVGIFGVHDGKEAGTVCAGVPPADD